MDWQALGEETIGLLQEYLRIDTTNPPGNESAGTRYLAGVLERAGVLAEVAEAGPGRGNLVARLRGDGSLGALVLHHHVDVVYADRRFWSVDPFGGEVRDGFLYGRGALDMKGIGALQLVAVLALARARVPLRRDVILLATADEEAGSAFGADWVAERRPDWLAGADYALSEFGGIYEFSGARAPVGTIHISEKTGLALRIVARGEPGHGSMPWPDTAPHRLVRALGRLLAAERPPRVLPEVQEYFRLLAQAVPGVAAAGLGDVARALADPARRARFLENRHWAAMVRTTFAVNMLHGSEKRNVIPPEATADIDCRMLAGDEPEEIRAWVERALGDPHVTVEIARPPDVPNLSPPDTDLYKALAEGLRRRREDAVVAPEILVAFTDNWVFRNHGLHAYGWSPFVLDQDEVRRVHGNDERVSLENLRAGARVYTELLLDFAAG